jgi:hypothetical protein
MQRKLHDLSFSPTCRWILKSCETWRSEWLLRFRRSYWVYLHAREEYSQKLIWSWMDAYITKSMEHTSWEADNSSASQEISGILWNQEAHCRIHNGTPPDPILSKTNLVHDPLSHFLEIHFNITPSSMPKSSKWSLSLRSPHPNPVSASPFPHTSYIPASFVLRDLITRKTFGDIYIYIYTYIYIYITVSFGRAW